MRRPSPQLPESRSQDLDPVPLGCAPEASEALLRAMLHHAQSAMALSTWPEIRLLDANRTWALLTGLDPEGVKGTRLPHAELFTNLREMAAILDTLQREGEVTDAPLQLKAAAGGVKHLLWSGKVVEAGGESFLVSSAVDISALKEARSDLEATEAQFQWAFQASPDGMALVSAAGTVLDLNPAMERLSGWPRAEALGQTTGPSGLAFWADPAARERLLNQLLEAGIVQGQEARFRRRDGSEFTGAVSGSLVKRQGSPCVLVSFRDMSAIREAQLQAQIREERLQFSLEGAELGTWDWEVPTGRMTCNARWSELLGFRPGELPPAHVSVFQALIHPEDRPRVRLALDSHLAGLTPSYECEHRVRHREGTWVWVLERGKVLARDPEGNPLRVCGTILDISPRKALEAELRATNARLNALLEALPDLLFVFSREGRFLSCHAPEGTLLMEPATFLGRAVEEVLPPGLAHQTRLAVEKACLEGKVQEFTYELEMPEGKRHFHTRIAGISEDEAVALTREIPAP